MIMNHNFMLFILNEKTIQQFCMKVLLIKVYKCLSRLSLELLNEIFYVRQNHYILRSLAVFATDNPRHKFLLIIIINNSTLF